MKVKFVGKKRVDYVSKKSGKQVLGYNLHFLEEGCNGVEGFSTFDIYLNDACFDSVFKSVPLGSLVNLCYDRNGVLTSVSIDNNK